MLGSLRRIAEERQRLLKQVEELQAKTASLNDDGKNAAAVALGSLGGKANTAAQKKARAAQASAAAKARWKKEKAKKK